MDILDFVRRRPTEEIIGEERLKKWIEEGRKIRHYIGFEISGLVHLGTGIICMEKVVDFQKAGFETNIFLADYHSWINEKLGGDLGRIRKIAKGYFKKCLEKCIETLGGDSEEVNFILASEIYDDEYWELVLKIAKNVTLKRTLRSLPIMGRKEREGVPVGWLFYPIMQVADIFKLNINLAHAGTDQRKAHVIALEVARKINREPPVCVHHKLIAGLGLTDEAVKKLKEAKSYEEKMMVRMDYKMSKSKPETCIFVHDSPEEIERKIIKAYCPWGETDFNPIIDIVENIILREEREFEIINEKTGERRVYLSFEELKRDWVEKKIHPYDLKKAVARELVEILKPVREYFEGPGKKYLGEMLCAMQSTS